MLTPEIQKNIQEWTQPPYDTATIAEIKALQDAGNEKELFDRFYTDLEFGTGGLRGLLGAGRNRMNRYTVARATQGLANYLKNNVPGDHAVAIAFDSRNFSTEFAQEAACVLAASGVKAYLFDALRPTPELSFSVRYLHASAGIVVTASHNPKEYNGYKVSWADGAQVVTPHDTGIIAEVVATDMANVKRADFEQAKKDGQIVTIGRAVDEAFFDAIQPLSIQPDVCKTMKDAIVYTPLHGAGIMLVPEALERWGFKNVIICEAQRASDGNFPNAPSPNPEEPAALQAAITDARANNAALVLATDPDSDRVGIAVRHNGDYQLITGNQIFALLVDYVLSARAKAGTLPADARVVTTIVTSELASDVSAKFGVPVDYTLTGFKWIGEKILQYETNNSGSFMVGGEESYGYLVGTHARDKDAVVASCLIAEMAADSAQHGETLVDRLHRIWSACGIYQESQLNIKFPGAEGVQKIQSLMTGLREKPPVKIAGIDVVKIEDYQLDTIAEMPSGKLVGKTNLPKSNVLIFRLADGSKIAARPSGTEPKIKFYFSVCDKANLPIAAADLPARIDALSKKHETMKATFAKEIEG